MSRNSELNFALKGTKNSYIRADIKGTHLCFEAYSRKMPTTKTAGLKQQILIINTNNGFLTSCEYPVYTGKSDNQTMYTNRNWSSTNHFNISMIIKAVIRPVQPALENAFSILRIHFFDLFKTCPQNTRGKENQSRNQ